MYTVLSPKSIAFVTADTQHVTFGSSLQVGQFAKAIIKEIVPLELFGSVPNRTLILDRECEAPTSRFL